MSENDHFWMQMAISLAKSSSYIDEVPVGAIIVKDNKIISTGINLRETTSDPTAHAEIIAIRKACKLLSSWRLIDCSLYVTMEPCVMCSGALVQSRIKRVVYGCFDPKGGGMGSVYSIHKEPKLNHMIECNSDILADESSKLLKDFFKSKRQKQKKPTHQQPTF